MGNEMECGCGCDSSCVEQQQGKELDEVSTYFALNNQDVMKQSIIKDSFISSLNMLYSYVSDQNSLSTKAVVIKSSSIEAFFSSKRNLLNYTKHEVNYYYNHIVLTNYLSKYSIGFIILQDFAQMNTGEEAICSFNNRLKTQLGVSIKKRDKKTLFKVERINLMSLDRDKIKEQLLNDFQSKLLKQYALNGILVTEDEEGQDSKSRPGSYCYNESSFNNLNLSKHFLLETSTNDFIVVYRQCKAEDYDQYEYYLDMLEEKISRESITQMLFRHQKNQELVSVIQTKISQANSNNDNALNDQYCFIFKKYKSKGKKSLVDDGEGDENADDDSLEYIVCDFTPGHSPFETYIKDICNKISSERKATLVALVNAIIKFYLIFRLDLDHLDSELI